MHTDLLCILLCFCCRNIVKFEITYVKNLLIFSITHHWYCDNHMFVQVPVSNSLKFYNDVIMSAMAFVHVQIKENIKVSRHWPLWREFTGDRWIPRSAEYVSIWWRHHALTVGNHKEIRKKHKPYTYLFGSSVRDVTSRNLKFLRNPTPWWRHQMETFSALLALCAGNAPVTDEFPSQRPVTGNFDVFFDLRLNKRLSKY